jgi:hypothetical protein
MFEVWYVFLVLIVGMVKGIFKLLSILLGEVEIRR